MNRQPPAAIPADILLAEDAPSAEADRIAAEFVSFGLTANLRVAAPKRAIGDIAWFILAAIPLQPFFRRLAEDAADDVHQRFKTFVNRLLRTRDARTPPKPVLVLQDTISGIQIVLHPDLPADSYQQLLGLDLSTVPPGLLCYDPHHQTWRSELRENF